MARLFLTNLDLNGNQLTKVRAEMLAADPTGGDLYEGRFWFNTTDDVLRYYDGTAVVTVGKLQTLVVDGVTLENTGTATNPNLRVKAGGLSDSHINSAANIAISKLAVDPRARATHTGTQPANTISDFDTQVRTNRLDQLSAPTADVSLNNRKITNVADPTNAQEAATKSYVDQASFGFDWKENVRVATTAVLPTNTRSGNVLTASANGALPSIDGVSLSVSDRILVKNEATGANNGIYTVTDLGSAGTPWVLTRSTDADTSGEVTTGLSAFVSAGTANTGTTWTLNTPDPITLNTTALAFVQTSGPGSVEAGNGLQRSGSTISLVTPVTVVNGGTGATTAAGARGNLGATTKVSGPIGDGTSASMDVLHNLNTRDVQVTVYDNNAPFAEVICDVEHKDVNTITLRFTTAPALNRYRVVIVG